MDDDLPGQVAQGSALTFYRNLRSVYVLGFLEILLGLAIITIESTALSLFWDPTIDFTLEILGIFVGILVIATGVVGFFAGRNKVTSAKRHKLFIAGIVITVLACLAVGSILVISILRTHFLYKDVKDKEGRDNSDQYRKLPYVFSLEGYRHQAQLRVIAAVIYSLTLLFLLGSALLNFLNVGMNKGNAENVTTYSPVATSNKPPTARYTK
ncbi:hypothetical protein RvY_18693 [Ramazzottius varieornatus]|uniref:MARVEL domain-containing protein n=1 Tax=Ramazzottius varieornatus TaxID=947166 RepID=A0A1D1W6Z1_RAMVA|nr:hypothetical protein RvY_18693 [Ramazzottius varieornatus]